MVLLFDSTVVGIASCETRSRICTGSVSRYSFGLSALPSRSRSVISVQHGRWPFRCFASWKRVLFKERGPTTRRAFHAHVFRRRSSGMQSIFLSVFGICEKFKDNISFRLRKNKVEIISIQIIVKK